MSTEPATALPTDLPGQIKLVDQATAELLADLGVTGRGSSQDGPDGWGGPDDRGGPDGRDGPEGPRASLAGADPRRPTLCAGWTLGHVLAHLARNADGMRRSAEGARRGEQVPMYDSADARDRDIEAGAPRPLGELVTDVTGASWALHATWAAMAPADWAHDMPHHRAGMVPLAATPRMRLYEVLIHHVDLLGDYGPADWPPVVVADMLGSLAEDLARGLPDGVGADVRDTGTGVTWTVRPEAAARLDVAGPSWALAVWLAGRPDAARKALTVRGGELPSLSKD